MPANKEAEDRESAKVLLEALFGSMEKRNRFKVSKCIEALAQDIAEDFDFAPMPQGKVRRARRFK